MIPARPPQALLGRCSVFLAALYVAGGCTSHDRPKSAPTNRTTTLPARGSTDSTASPAEDGQWRMPARDYASTRYSGLNQITAQNVGQLRMAWSFSTGVTRGHEAAPLVVGSTMYVVTPFPNILYALDLTQPGGPLKWTYKPDPALASQGVACCDLVNRGAAYFDGKIFYNTLDAHTVAVDAATGKEVWKTKVGDFTKGESVTMAPRRRVRGAGLAHRARCQDR